MPTYTLMQVCFTEIKSISLKPSFADHDMPYLSKECRSISDQLASEEAN